MPDRLDQLHKLHAADPDDAELPYMIALEHGNAGRHDQAVTWLDKALAADPAMCYAYFQKARHLAAVGRDADALATLDAGIAAATRINDAKALGELRELKASLE
jgi:tetratricopeptide (TPR) repeat protein